MAKQDYFISLISAHYEGKEDYFRSLILQLKADASRKKHNIFVNHLDSLLRRHEVIPKEKSIQLTPEQEKLFSLEDTDSKDLKRFIMPAEIDTKVTGFFKEREFKEKLWEYGILPKSKILLSGSPRNR